MDLSFTGGLQPGMPLACGSRRRREGVPMRSTIVSGATLLFALGSASSMSCGSATVITNEPDAGGGGSVPDAGSSGHFPDARDGGGFPDASGSSAGCTNPQFMTSDPNGGWSDGGYYVHNNMWNIGGYQVTETLYACSYRSWYVVANMNNDSGDGAVKTYPNVHKDYNDVPISSFNTITSTFAEASPHVGIYNVAFDIWTNGVATPGSTEIMIWNENFNQVPGGARITAVTLG